MTTHSLRAGFGASAGRRRAADRAARRHDGASGPSAASRFAPWGVDLSARDPAIKPGDDFWRYANNSWFPANPIPTDRTELGRLDRAQRGCRGAGPRHRRDRQSRHRPGQPPGRRHVCELYGRGRHRGARHRAAAALSRPHRRRGQSRRFDPAVRRARLSGADRRRHHCPIRPTRPATSPRRPGRARHAQPRLLSARGRAISTASAPPIGPMWSSCCGSPASPIRRRRPTRIIALERRIAEAHWTPERSRDIRQIYNPMNREQLIALAPQFNWPLCWRRRAWAASRPSSSARPRRSPPRAGCSRRCRWRPGRTG